MPELGKQREADGPKAQKRKGPSYGADVVTTLFPAGELFFAESSGLPRGAGMAKFNHRSPKSGSPKFQSNRGAVGQSWAGSF